MAQRPVFVPVTTYPLVRERLVEFVWHPGFAKAQALRNIRGLHESATELGLAPLLEISSRSPEPLGRNLSALSLTFEHQGCRLSVESAFQGSKVFEQSGPFQDLYKRPGHEARADERLRNSGSVVGFQFFEENLPAEPKTAFYDWLYINALRQNPDSASQLSRYRGFTDIAFNPKRSLNCQARAAALYVALGERGFLGPWQDFFRMYRVVMSHETGEMELFSANSLPGT